MRYDLHHDDLSDKLEDEAFWDKYKWWMIGSCVVSITVIVFLLNKFT
jgi:hypothetical protein